MSFLQATDNTVLQWYGLGKYPYVRTRMRLDDLVKPGRVSCLSKPQPGRRPRYANNAVGWGY
ncbi:MAG: hypothetical protein F6J90_05450 [Moorea sp. SIOASIH]|nr:hypothetical protein [Moorena sp. SIOASIH]